MIENFDQALRIHQNDPFDAVLLELFNTDCGFGLAHQLNLPIIGISTCELVPWYWEKIDLYQFGDPVENLRYFKSNNCLNFFGHYLSSFLFKNIQRNDDQLLFEKFGDRVPSVSDLQGPDLVIINRFSGIHGQRALTQNVMEIGGIHLPKDQDFVIDLELEKVLDEAEIVIYVNWGTVINSSSMGDLENEFWEAFLLLSENTIILWKWENVIMERTRNVLRNLSFPQNQILSHNKTKLFWTHGGVGSIFEAVYHNVPVIVTPIFGDQFYNGAALEHLDVAELLDYDEISQENILRKFENVINSEDLRLRMGTLSREFRLWRNYLDRDLPMRLNWLIETTIQRKQITNENHVNLQIGTFISAVCVSCLIVIIVKICL